MNLEDVIRARHSVRAYLPDPVPQETIRRLLNLARWAPNGAD